MGVNVSLRNDTDRVIKGYMEMLGGARVAGWKFKLQPLGEEGCTFQKKDGGLSIGLPYNCVLNVDLDGDGRPDKIRYRFKAEKQTKLVVSEMLKSVQVKLSGGDDSLIMTSSQSRCSSA